MSILAIILGAVAAFAVGALWYGLLFSKQWQQAAGLSDEDIQKQDPTPFVIAFVGALLASAVLYHMFAAGGVTGVVRCLGYGAGIGALVVAPWIVLHYAFAGRPKSLWWIDGGHTVASFAVLGLVLGLFL